MKNLARILTFRFPFFIFLGLVGIPIGLFPQTNAGKIAVRSESFGNVFAAETGLLKILFAEPSSVASGSVILTDEAENPVGQIPIPAGSEGVDVPLATRGFYHVRVSMMSRNGEKTAWETSAAVIGNPISEEERGRSSLGFFGVQASHPLAAVAGGRWNRFFVHLDAIKESGESFSWSYSNRADSSFGAGSGMGLYPKNQTWVACLMAMPRWLSVTNDITPSHPFINKQWPPKDWDKLEKLIQWVTPFFPADLKYLEVMNEPDAVWQGSDAELVRYHRVVAKAVKSVRPDIRILGPCLTSVKMELLVRLDKLGLFENLDGLAMHPYVNGTAPENEFIQRVVELKKYFDSTHGKNFPIFFTEFGWQTGNGGGEWQRPVDELTRARYLSRGLTLLGTQGIDALLYFCLLYQSGNKTDKYSVLYSDSTPTPGYAAFATLSRKLAGARKNAKWLRLSSTTHLVLFQKPASTLGVLWDTAASVPVAIPMTGFLSAETMTGRSETPRKGSVTASPSPIFLEWADAQLFDLSLSNPELIRQGEEKVFSGSEFLLAHPLSLDQGKIRISTNVETGEYLVIEKNARAWRGSALSVVSPLMILSNELFWSPKESRPTLLVRGKSFFNQPIRAKITAVTPQSLDLSSSPFPIQPGGAFVSEISLESLVLGKRYLGKLTVSGEGDQSFLKGEMPLDLTLSSAEAIPDGVSRLDWKQIPKMDFSEWAPFVGSESVPWLDYQDCYANAQAVYNREGLRLNIKVRDNHHIQNQSPQDLWKEDSLQMAFDVDVERPWEPNTGKGWNGHRVMEYGIAMGRQGPMVWRWGSYSDLPANSEEKRISAEIRRTGEITEYAILFPWECLSLKDKPSRGTRLGFALLVNDFDRDGQGRHGLRLFNGIHPGKDPTLFGRLYLK